MPVLITNNGVHSAEKWADATAQMIFPVDANVEGERLLLARKTQVKVAEALEPHHSTAQSKERDKLNQDADSRMVVGLHDVHDDAQAAFNAVCDALKGTPWESKTQDPEWQTIVRNTIGQHMADIQHIERRQFSHGNPGNEKAKAYRMHYDHAHGVPLEHLEDDERQALVDGGPNELYALKQRKLQAPQG